jgi:hypothetical protein
MPLLSRHAAQRRCVWHALRSACSASRSVEPANWGVTLFRRHVLFRQFDSDLRHGAVMVEALVVVSHHQALANIAAIRSSRVESDLTLSL